MISRAKHDIVKAVRGVVVVVRRQGLVALPSGDSIMVLQILSLLMDVLATRISYFAGNPSLLVLMSDRSIFMHAKEIDYNTHNSYVCDPKSALL